MAFSAPNPCLNLYRLCIGVSTTGLKIALAGVGSALFLVLGFCGGYCAISLACEDSGSFIGGGNVCACI